MLMRKSISILTMMTVSLLGLVAAAHGEPPARAKDKFTDAERAFRDARTTLLKEYVDDSVSEDDLYRAAVAGMLSAGGSKWDALLSPMELGDLHGDLAGELVGIGIEIE